MARFEDKIAAMLAGRDTPTDFIIADAKDADMAAGLSATGLTTARQGRRFRTRAEYIASIRDIIRQDIVDIMLVSCSILETLVEQAAFAGTGVRSAIRANDTSDLWRCRGATYTKTPSIPFRSAALAGAQTDLGLYSMTFVNDAAIDARSLEQFQQFRTDASAVNFRYFMEIFNPNVETGIDAEHVPFFINDMIIRALAGLRRAERPVFLKVAYNGPAAMEELASFDPGMIVGVMGGGSGTTRDCLELLHQAQRFGARAALFGRKINDAASPTALIAAMRHVVDGDMKPEEATRFYHDALVKDGITPLHALDDDLSLTESVLRHAA
ncbi:hypothetical protein AA103196_0105 [Ameyamaea chiangmaiensis NBRC 103196]|uniref:Fructose-bisphosphate aldolase n=1 Tax=Ameyamaea chiangmaiensis TaxID=442969 RepID=A0A850P6B3_9PROT|nr:hypothetical protein [Ameyamaea chiangmaiensis]MBS4075936.1 hypothetical protein [Ameyamaea chiangmaiensis]NVN40185.1 hypothetical protein [Ameyamaea chiangmaiensis]GBQ61677.1 hypothetical protein AA103196_0105 [Ameyamaea chiangmaiensis NBRC 103196]